MNDVAVCYLARLAEGFPAFQRFADSYRKHPTRIDHDLVIIAKGFTKAGELAALQHVFAGLNPRFVEVDDDCGFDIHAYSITANRIENGATIFLNTYSEILSNEWLEKLHSNFIKPGVGLVGATSSFESLYSSYKLIHKLTWLGERKIFISKKTTRSLLWLCKMVNKYSLEPLQSRKVWLKQAISSATRHSRRTSKTDRRFDVAWKDITAPGQPYHEASQFPSFPNPHIRSNAFMIDRKRFIRYVNGLGSSKMDCCRFESGHLGFTNLVRSEGLKALLVGADGIGYEVDQWANAGCFRSGGQKNLLIKDNQTADYSGKSALEQDAISMMSWGSYRNGAEGSELVGISFKNTFDLTSPVRCNIKRDPSKSRLFSVVIPCKNRAHLLIDAISTVTRQEYDNFEICVFDNASERPIASVIPSDNRIRIERSDEPLHVTDSWNKAMDMARGEYVILIGDDDALLPGFFDRISGIADAFNDPDVVFSSLFQFVHPGVSQAMPEGYVANLPMADFMEGRKLPFLLSKEDRRRSVDNSLAFRRSFMFNMPAFTAKKAFLDSIRHNGSVFRPPFPDYYFANIALERADSIVVEPSPIALQGISKVSFGNTLFNGTTENGFKVLGKIPSEPLFDALQPNILPVSQYQTEYLLTMASLADTISDNSRAPSIERYRTIEVAEALAKGGRRAARRIEHLLSSRERLWLNFLLVVRFLGKRISPFRKAYDRYLAKFSPHEFQPLQTILDRGSFAKNSDVYCAIEKGDIQFLA